VNYYNLPRYVYIIWIFEELANVQIDARMYPPMQTPMEFELAIPSHKSEDGVLM